MSTLYVDIDEWPRVTLGDTTWAVCPRYIGPVAIGEAATMAEHHGCELPTKELVDAIWRHADCKLNAYDFVRKHDGTPKTMASLEVLKDQSQKIERAITAWESTHGPARLVAGCAKDVIRLGDGRLALYGWQTLDGKVIQPIYAKHALEWIDYSQHCRLVRKVDFEVV